jgi:hypothetical protein
MVNKYYIDGCDFYVPHMYMAKEKEKLFYRCPCNVTIDKQPHKLLVTTEKGPCRQEKKGGVGRERERERGREKCFVSITIPILSKY